MDGTLTNLWAKTSRDDEDRWHPLILHMLDVAASADAILRREPQATRERMAQILGLPWEDAHPWLLLLVACHDLGKACPGFQCKWKSLTGLQLPRNPNTNINHAYVSQLALTELLRSKSWPEALAELVADAVGCHHGSRASEKEKEKAEAEIYVGRGAPLEAVRKDWVLTRRDLLDTLLGVLRPSATPTKQMLDGPDFMLLSGLTSFADWIGSNEECFPFGEPEDCANLNAWFLKRRVCADRAMGTIGWEQRTPLAKESRGFSETFRYAPRPLQQAVAEALTGLNQPAVLLVEAPMGEGKTEAAFFAHLELQRKFGHRGFYVALPTMATGNAMFTRTLRFLEDQGANRSLDLQLVHSSAVLNERFKALKVSPIYDQERKGEVRAGEWFTNKKRALLSEYGVGTVDQALLPILPVRHHFVRLWGLANRVVVFDEIHAYDAYTGTLLVHLLRWLMALGSSVVLLSATLPPSVRRELANKLGAALSEPEEPYPRLSIFHTGNKVRQLHFDPDPARRLAVRLQGIPSDLLSMRSALEDHLAGGGSGLALVNTVQRAQELYRLFPEGETLKKEENPVGKRLPDGTEIFLFHARFPANRRQAREEQVLETFGMESPRRGRTILIATQVAEQSLDLDFDVIATDLAPIDLVLQRAGRLWRHARSARPVAEAVLLIAGLAEDKPPSFRSPLWWGKVYREDILLRTWILLRDDQRETLWLPDDIDALVQKVYDEQVEVPEFLDERMTKAIILSDGEALAHRQQAHQAIIGLPDDESWNDPGRFVLYDEDDPGVHRTLMAQTRLGEDSIIAIPLWDADGFNPEITPELDKSKAWFLRAVSLSRPNIVKKLSEIGVPKGWKESVLLRNCFPLHLNAEGRWTVDTTVRLDDSLGIVYETKEPQ